MILSMFAWLVIIVGGGGMAIAFVFMWSVSILEMWLFNKAFVNAKGERCPIWSTMVEDKLHQMGCPDATTIVKKIACFITQIHT